MAAHAVVFVTDFGSDDSYAAGLVGACWRVDPELRCVAGTHGVPPQDVLAGAYHAKAVAQAFPPGTVICAVVDPGVGTARRLIATQCGDLRCVAPDNGLVSYLWAEADPRRRRCVAIPVSAEAAPTFHGRDVLAPAAARLAVGDDLDGLGAPVETPRLLAEAFAVGEPGGVVGRVAVVDRFGNAITTVRVADLDGGRAVAASWEGGEARAAVRTYAELADGQLGVVIGSAGHVEIAARMGPATDLGGPRRGQVVRIAVQR
jgi:S-adenosylmethionine hydrolase